MHNFCAICGVYIRPTSAGPGPGLPTEDVEWHQELRAVRRAISNNTTCLTGVGYLNSSEVIIAPQDPKHSYLNVSASLESYLPFYDPEVGVWTFTFHAACWEVLHERISGDLSNISHLASLLFSTLYCITWNEHKYLRPGHSFGGAAKFQRPFGDPLQDMLNEGYSHFAVEPSKFVSLDVIRRCVGPIVIAPRSSDRVVAFGETTAPDIFSKLPVEVVHLVLTWLPSDDVQHLRLASKSVACISRADSLSQFFWRSRFSLNFEMGFALPTHRSSHQNWRALYFAIKHELQTPQGSARLRNRKRIWEIVSKNASLFSLHLHGVQLHGIPIAWDDFSKSGCQEKSAGEPGLGKIITTELTTRDSEILHVGSREISVRRLPLQSEQQSICAVGVSTVVFNSRMFVSGLRVLFQDSITRAYASHSLGYVTSDSESLLRIAPEDSFAGLELATCVNGIVGVRVMLEAGSRKYSAWVGDIGKGQPDVAFGTLCLRNEMRSFDLAGSFDAFKMIALAMIDIKQSDVADCTSKASERFCPQGLIPQSLWTPCYPRTKFLIPVPDNLKYQTFNPILNINFGGTSGEALQKLTRIVSHMEDTTAAFVGFMFDFDGQTPTLHGRQGRTEVSFLINGARGERISEVTYEQASTSVGIWSLHIHTNFRRGATFIPDELRVERPGEPPPGLVLTPFEVKYYEVEYSKKTLRAPEGQMITGFTSILGASSGVFQTLGLQCTCMSESTVPMTFGQNITGHAAASAAELCSSVGSYLIGGASSGCNAYTYASLNGVRRIRFSCGSTARPRQANEISGLWLDYVEPQPPEILGQWLSEVDSMDINPDESVIEVSIGISKLGFSFNEKFHLGRVVRISVLTSRMQLKTVQSVESLSVDDCIELNFRANKLEKLASFVWAFNALWDHPRALSSPTTDSDLILLWDPRCYSSTFPWMVPEKILWDEAGLKGETDRVIAITAYRTLTYGVKYITGFVFTYKSGATHTIGYTHGEPSREASFGDNERNVLLELFSGRYGLLDIILHSESLGGEHTRREPHALVGEPIGIPDAAPTVYHDWIDLSASQYKEYALDRDGHQEIAAPTDLPHKEVVGLWGFNMGSGKLILGVIYSGKPEEDGIQP